jgi:hypothetical protein
LVAVFIVAVACTILWNDTGGDVRGYEVHRLIHLHHAGQRLYPGQKYRSESQREMVRKASSMARLSQRSRVKQLLKTQALRLATKAAISEVADTYAPQAWFAMHRHPEKAAMLHVANSRHDDDKIIDKVRPTPATHRALARRSELWALTSQAAGNRSRVS